MNPQKDPKLLKEHLLASKFILDFFNRYCCTSKYMGKVLLY